MKKILNKFFCLTLLVLTLNSCSAQPTTAGDADSTANNQEVAYTEDQNVQGPEVEIIEKNGRFIVICKENMRLYLYDYKTNCIAQYPMACGRNLGDKEKRGDLKTPEGIFKIQQIQDASTWSHDFGDGKGEIKGAYGSHFIRLVTPPHSGIGIHGTHDASSIGKRATEGCIRLNNNDLLKLVKEVYVGMPVIITSSIEDMESNQKPRITKYVGVNATASAPATKVEPSSTKANIDNKTSEREQHPSTPKTHTIRSNETIGGIALKYGMRSDELMKLNNISDPDRIREGQVLKVK